MVNKRKKFVSWLLCIIFSEISGIPICSSRHFLTHCPSVPRTIPQSVPWGISRSSFPVSRFPFILSPFRLLKTAKLKLLWSWNDLMKLHQFVQIVTAILNLLWKASYHIRKISSKPYLIPISLFQNQSRVGVFWKLPS